ncbi:MAG: hypothetical protein CME68_06150 [Halobacteriovoraceae bacterium]|nr:hypothetical protein [Halobacteriovoraceae bacterium]
MVLSSCGGGDSSSSSSSDNKIGGCVLKTARALPGSNLRAVSSVSATDGSATYAPFTKILTSYGTTMLSIASVSDSFVGDIGTTIEKMFDSSVDTDTSIQNTFIENSYKYAATIPLFIATDFNNFDFQNSKDNNSICDTISAGQESRNTQVLEIMEHILHIMTDVGFHYTYPEEWGLTTSSTLYTCMQQAISSGYFNASSYDNMDAEVKDRVRLQEFAYWFISSAWGLQTTYGDNDTSEWTLKSQSALQSNMSSCYATLMTNTVNKVLISPSNTFLNNLGDDHKAD